MATPSLDYFGEYRQQRDTRARNRARAVGAARTNRALDELNRSRTVGEVAADTGLALTQGAVSLGESAYGIGNLATLGGLEAATGMSENFRETQDVLQRSKSPQMRYQALNADRAFENDGVLAGVADYITNPALLGDLAASQVASVLPGAAVGTKVAKTVGAGGVARGMTADQIRKEAVRKGTSAAAMTGGAQMGGTAYVSAYNQAIEEGLSPEEANERALAAGASTAAAGAAISRIPGVGAAGVEAQVAGKVTGIPGATGTFARTLGDATRREATEEFAQSGTEQAIQNVASTEKELMDGVAKNAALGAVGGGLLGMGMGVAPASSRLRQQIQEGLDDAGAASGEPEAAKSSLEQRGEDLLQNEAEQVRAVQNDPVVQALTQAGFQPTEDGRFVRPDDPLVGDQIFTAEEALDYASEEVEAFETTDQLADQMGVEDTGPVTEEPVAGLPDVEEGLPLPEVEGEERGFRAFSKAERALAERGMSRAIVDGRPVYRMSEITDDGESTIDFDETAAIDVAAQAGLVTANEAAEARRYAELLAERRSDPRAKPAPEPRGTTPQTEFMDATTADQEVALKQSGYYVDDDGRYVTAVDGEARTVDRATALQELGYVAPTEDLLGDPLSSKLPETQEEGENTELTGQVQDPLAGPQMLLRGVSPLFDVVDEFRRKQFGTAKLQELATRAPGLPAPGEEFYAQRAWESLIDGAVQQQNELRERRGESPVTVTASMRKSKLVRGFIEDAVAQGIEPTSNEAFDYIQERARDAETSSVAAAQMLSDLAETANAYAPGTADLGRWKKALARRKIATPGQMRGSAYQQFKEAVEKATITPGSAEFDTFMQNFSATLDDSTSADTTFGRAIRKAYPYVKPEQAVENKRSQIVAPKPVAKKPPIGQEVLALTKTARESAITEPVAEVPKTAKPKAKRVNDAKRKTKATINQNYEEELAVEEEMEIQVRATRARARDLVSDDPVDVDPDAARAEEEATRIPNTRAADTQTALEVERVMADAERRIAAMAERFENDVKDLKAAIAAGTTERSRNDDAWQAAITAEVGERLSTVDTALAKDVPDIASWAGLAGVVMRSPEFSRYADANTKYEQFVRPMLSRFANLVTGTRSSDAVRLYRAVFDKSEIAEFVGNELGGKQKQSATNEVNFVNRLMDEMIDRKTADPANMSNQHPFKTNKQKFSLNSEVVPEGGSMPFSQLRELADAWNSARTAPSLPIEVFATVADVQAELGIAIPAAANGVYYNGRAIAIAENITDKAMAHEVMVHERTHGGLEGLLGADRLPAVTNRLWANAQIRGRIQQKMRSNNLSRTEAAEEVLVDMAVSGESLNKSVFSKVRAAINRSAETVLGLNDYVMPDAAVNELLRDTADYLRGAKHELNLTEDYVDGLEAYMWVVDGRSVPVGPKFSVAATSLDEVREGDNVQSDTTKFSNKYHEALKEGLGRNWQARGKGGALSVGQRIRRFGLDFMPATQIANLNRGLFYDAERNVDLLQSFVEDKLSKENDFNKVLNNERKTFYTSPEGEFTFEGSIRDVIKEWQDVTRKGSGQADTLNVVNQQGTFYKVHPDRSWEQQSELDYEKVNFTQAERRQAYQQVRSQWDKLTPENKQLYRKVQAVYADMWAERMQELRNLQGRAAESSTELPDPDQPSRSIGTGEWKRKMDRRIDVAIGKIKEGPYSPLQRFGDYYTVIKNRAGDVVFSSGHTTRAEAEGMMRSMGRDLEEGYKITTSKRSEFASQMSGLSLQQYNQIREALKGVFPGADATDTAARSDALMALEEVFLQSMPDSSLLKHANARKNIGGATMDSFRAFNDYAIKTARNLSSMRYDHKIQGALNEMAKYPKTGDNTALNIRRSEVFDAIQAQHKASQEAQIKGWSSKASQFGYLMYMTSPSQMFLNTSQTALVTLPRMAAQYGTGATMKFIKEAGSGFLRSKTRGMHLEDGGLDTNTAVFKVLQSLHQDGTLDFTLTHDINELSQRDSDTVHSRWQQAIESMSVFIHRSEVFNRETAAYVTVRGEMKNAGLTDAQFAQLPAAEQAKLLEDWSTKAKRNVLETQFEYSQTNKAARTQGNFPRLIFQFQQFRLNMLAMMAKDIRDSFGVNDPSLNEAQQREATKLARKSLSYMVGTQLLLTGAGGSVIAPVVFAMMDLMDDEDELLGAQDRFMQAAPSWLSMGALGSLLNTDPQRFGFQTLLPFIGETKYMPDTDKTRDTLDHILLNSLGPLYGIGTQYVDGFDMVAQGQFSQGVTKFMPKPFADATKAWVTELDGIKDRQGITWYEPSNFDRVMNTMGLKTGSQAEAQADRSAIYSGTIRASTRRSNLVGKWVTADNYEARVEAMEEIQNWNQRWASDQSLAIKSSTLQTAMRTRKEKERIALETGVPSTRTPDAVKRLVRD